MYCTSGGERGRVHYLFVVHGLIISHREDASLVNRYPNLCEVHARSHQTFRPVLAVKLLGIMLRNRCWPTTFHTITAEDADGWC